MAELSNAVGLVWVTAASEAAGQLHHEFIEPEHAFIALCRAAELIDERALQEIRQAGADAAAFKAELKLVPSLLQGLGQNPQQLRRELRGLLGKGQFQQKSGEAVHRSERCKAVFDRAEKMAAEMQSASVQTGHLALAILASDNRVAQFLRDRGIDSDGFAVAIRDVLAGKRQLQPCAPAGAPPAPVAVAAGNADAPRDKRLEYLPRFGHDLTQLAREGKLKPVIGRREEMRQLARTLARSDKNNPLLIGEPGVGKTAVIEGLAQRIASGEISDATGLAGKRIWSLDMGLLGAGTQYRGEFGQRLTNIIREVEGAGDIILFIDEIHTVIGAGGHEGMEQAPNILKPALTRGSFPCVGATTVQEYRKYFEKDPALTRRFQPIWVEEPSEENTAAILEGVRPELEKHHGLPIDREAIQTAVEMSVRYLPDRRLPDKAKDVLDQAAALVRIPGSLRMNEPPSAGVVYAASVTAEAVARVIADMTGIPVGFLHEDERSRLAHMEQDLKARVIGQDEAVDAVAAAIRTARLGLSDPRRPTGVFLFLGPPGVGKTELARALASLLFARDEAMIRIDLSEYKEKHTVSRLIGSPPGYVGYEEEGQLTGPLRNRPYSVVLLDEVEKAHPEVLDIFLPLFEEGRLTDGRGRTVDGKHAVYILTSNAGFETSGAAPFGFVNRVSDSVALRQQVNDELGRYFRRELLDRIDRCVVFRSLGPEQIAGIIRLELHRVQHEQLANRGLTCEFEPSAIDWLVQEAWRPERGARVMKRCVQQSVIGRIAEAMARGQIHCGERVRVWADASGIRFAPQRDDLPTQRNDGGPTRCGEQL